MAYGTLLTTLLLGAAQVLSPAGLNEVVIAGGLTNATFEYVSDESIFGAATFDRGSYDLSRVCCRGFKPCPATLPTARVDDIYGVTLFATTLPDNITECFSSGTVAQGDLRSSSFDIQFRPFSNETGVTAAGVPYQNVTGIYRYIGQVTMEPGYHVREGLVIDATDGVKTIKLQYKEVTRPSLENLKVLDVKSVNYTSEREMPVWGVENPGSNWTVADISLQWGIISETSSHMFAQGIRTLRGESLPLPASLEAWNGYTGNGWGDSLAGSRVAGLVLWLLFKGNSWQGGTDYATTMRWVNLSSNPHTAHQITNLRWTELAANMVTGTKSRLGNSSVQYSSGATGEILIYRKTIVYRYQFGVAAYLCCALWLTWTLACLYMLCILSLRGRISPSNLSVMINLLSSGRLTVWGQTGRETLFHIPTREWLNKYGSRVINLSPWVGNRQSEIKSLSSDSGEAMAVLNGEETDR
ncbi:hypothetical protein B0H67DRAFT_683642 [Lasiosphaeris hirsuta]|uniref:Uncharacterized protein n=1 Tax=Lasiosphaeris hirsuta TaxID=260670 RepID=A0AA40AGK4_9PEZI|nr:hypothetical protein B0H67DRAFT_683642 [Lasiosphaeris hirsuta]